MRFLFAPHSESATQPRLTIAVASRRRQNEQRKGGLNSSALSRRIQTRFNWQLAESMSRIWHGDRRVCICMRPPFAAKCLAQAQYPCMRNSTAGKIGKLVWTAFCKRNAVLRNGHNTSYDHSPRLRTSLEMKYRLPPLLLVILSVREGRVERIRNLSFMRTE